MITVQINDAEVETTLSDLAAAYGDLSELMNGIGNLLKQNVEDRFDDGVSPEGVPWAPKSLATIAAYEARGLAVSLKPLFGPNTDGTPLRRSFFHEYGPDHVEVGTNKIQAAVMQFGATQGQFGATIGKDKRGRDHFQTIPWGDIPARPYLGFSGKDRDAILEAAEEWLESIVED